MGSGRDKRKKAKPRKPGQGADKTLRKTEANEEKATRRTERQTKGGEDDLDALLAQFQLQDKAVNEVSLKPDCRPPSARVHASFTPIGTSKDPQILIFGGESEDTVNDKFHTYGDLYLFCCNSNTWTQIHSPKGPAPRTSHQALQYKGYMYVFGGEMTSLNMERFRHFRETWRLSLQDWRWEQLPNKKGPAARSGHRMALWQSKLILFGGFHDSGDDRKPVVYYNDVWAFDTDALSWEEMARPDTVPPPPRGGSQVAVYGDSLYVYGGHRYSVAEDGSESEVVMDDMWQLDLRSLQWQRLKRQGLAPGARAAFSMVTHRGRAILFGGTTDQKGRGEKVYSELHNELFQFSFERQRWYPVLLKPPKQRRPDAASDADGSDAAGMDPSSPLYRAAVRIQARYRGYAVRKAFKTYKLGGKMSELLYSPAAYGVDLAAQNMVRPRARRNPLMAVHSNTLWLLGGIVEVEAEDVTLDDIWKLDLAKLDGWHCVKENTQGEEIFKQQLEAAGAVEEAGLPSTAEDNSGSSDQDDDRDDDSTG